MEIEVEVECDKCGKKLDATFSVNLRGVLVMSVEVCDTCLEEMRNQGTVEGKAEGYSEGYDAGRKDTEDRGLLFVQGGNYSR